MGKEKSSRKMPDEQKNMPSLGQRLKQIRKDLGLTQGQMAARLQTGQSSLSRFEKDLREPGRDFLAKVSQLGISVDWLLTGRGAKRKPPTEEISEEAAPYGADLPEDIRQKVAELARAAGVRGEAELQKMAKCAVHFISGGMNGIEIDDEYVSVPLLSDAAAAGSPTEIDEDHVEGRCVIYRGALRNPDHTTCVWVRGDSMQPVLPNGSIVAVNHARTDIADLDGKIVAAYHEEGVTIKRLMLADQAIILMPENRAGFSPIHFDFDEDRVIGACEWAWIDLT